MGRRTNGCWKKKEKAFENFGCIKGGSSKENNHSAMKLEIKSAA